MTLDIEITSPHGTNLMQQVGIPSLKAVADPERSKQFEYSVCSGDIGHRGAAAFSPALVCFKGRGNCEIMIADKDDNFRMSSEECKMQDSFLGMEKQKSNSLILRIRKFIRRFEPDASSDFRTIKRLIQDDISTAYVAQNKSRPLGRFDRAGSRGPLGDTICRGGDEALIRRRRRGHTPLGGLTGSSQNLALLCNTNEGDSKKEDFQGKNHSGNKLQVATGGMVLRPDGDDYNRILLISKFWEEEVPVQFLHSTLCPRETQTRECLGGALGFLNQQGDLWEMLFAGILIGSRIT
eukprot:CAMPEP_0184481122 /NCGR_PEP_ID=MMETSP0113_2-20130426/2662_1 /TAXON_ID=91329 /ORGANISM="Norrisiella sphaerica, Strain BC52" /LENGTH=293 /DNA_ID=CAMNT_0026860049 /DNA_START=186 /DNA_END=1071 /DNA_ORIENTATION=+